MIVPTWPDMTADDKAAVAKYKSALKAHEVMHFDVTDKVVKALPKTVKATGSDPADATDEPPERSRHLPVADAKPAIDTATTDYDTLTGHGATQSAVGGVDVPLACP